MFKQILLILFLAAQTIKAQNSPPLRVTVERVAESDSIWISLRQEVSTLGTLMVVAKAQEAGISDTLYYPVIDTTDEFLLTVPENFLNNHISITGLYYPGLRKVIGKLNNPKVPAALEMFLIGNDIGNYTKIIELGKENYFILPRLVFENKATVFFNFIGTKQKPDISIEELPEPTDYDSLMSATFNFGANLFTSNEFDSLKLIGKLPENAKRVEGKGKELQQIVVEGKRKTTLERYKEQYPSWLFRDVMEREYNFLDNDDILYYFNCLTYLQAKAPGLSMRTDRSTGQQVLYWRNTKIRAYFIDEMEVDIGHMMMVDVATIAYMRLMPTVMGGTMNQGNGGGVAVYTRKGDFVRAGSTQNNYIFSIKGYTPSKYSLFSAK
jgi:hypothetical protein